MTKIAPFKALIYNQKKINDLSKVICPPYDIISAEKQQHLHELSPYNLVHLELSKDSPDGDKYTKSAHALKDWIESDVLKNDDNPSIYFYSQQYCVKGEKKTRFGFIALLKLEEDKPSVYGHEHTHLEPKEDRLRLIRQVKANLSPIFVVFQDKKKIIQQDLKSFARENQPFIDIVDEEKIRHMLWRVDSKDIIAKIQKKMQPEDIFIADGHHRYEVSRVYRDEMKAKSDNFTQEEGFNYIMAYFTNIDPQGLTIFAIHRLVRLDSKPDMNYVVSKLAENFHVEELKDREKFFFLLQKAGMTEHAIGMVNGNRNWLLRLKTIRVLEEFIKDKPKEYRSLDVAILNSLILTDVLNLTLQDKTALTFSAETDEILRQVRQDDCYIAFLLNPTKMEQIVQVALKGEKMPPKSTYFYPKVASGLVVNKHE